MKECNKCKQIKSEDQYSKGKNQCKRCASEYFKKYWRETSKQNISVNLPDEKKCTICQETFPITEFYIRRDRNKPISRCKKCNNQATKDSYSKLTDTQKKQRFAKNKKWRDIQIKQGNLKVFFTAKLCSYKSIAKKKNLQFDLTIEYLIDLYEKQNKKCYYTNRELTLDSFRGDGKCVVKFPNYHYQASLDKLVPEKGYVKGNVVWCAWLINTCKNMLTENQFYDLCKTVLENRKCQDEIFGESEKEQLDESDPF
jgi:hypothetical protein